MSEENTNQPQEGQNENLDQEELAKQWEEALNQQQETGKEENTAENQEELAKQWEEALNQQESHQSQEGSEENQEELAKQWEEALNQQSEGEQKTIASLPKDKKLELLLDIPLEISVEIGGRTLPLEDLLKLTPNTVFELNRYINEPIDIKINGKPIAKGELYTVENNFGIKITSIITVEERIKLLLEKGGEF